MLDLREGQVDGKPRYGLCEVYSRVGQAQILQ